MPRRHTINSLVRDLAPMLGQLEKAMAKLEHVLYGRGGGHHGTRHHKHHHQMHHHKMHHAHQHHKHKKHHKKQHQHGGGGSHY